MKIRKVLFPTDLSAASNGALEIAASLARDSDATLLITHVEEPAPAYGGGNSYFIPGESASQELQIALERLIPSRPDVNVEHHLLTGDPALVLVRLAKDEDVDLIVMSTHGRTGILHVLLGSVAEAVVRRATCPVLTFRQTESEPAATT